jgi:hypothetical protein
MIQKRKNIITLGNLIYTRGGYGPLYKPDCPVFRCSCYYIEYYQFNLILHFIYISSDTSSVPRPGATIQYLIRVQGPGEICCEALTCTRYSCSMKYIGCGRNNWSSADLQWVGDSLQTPKMRCKTYYRIHITIYYSFKTTH